MRFTHALLFSPVLVHAHFAVQTIQVQDPLTPRPYDDGLFTPFQDLNALSSTHFTVLTHPAFPEHHVRVKASRFCDETVQ